MASRPPKPPLPPPAERKLSRLALLWRFARAYPLQLSAALAALCVAALTTLAIPQGLKTVVDNGFARGSDPTDIAPFFVGFLGLVLLLGLATAVRFFFVSWIGERVVADLGSRRVRDRFARMAEAERALLDDTLRRLRCEAIRVETGSDVAEPFRAFFARRGARRAG